MARNAKYYSDLAYLTGMARCGSISAAIGGPIERGCAMQSVPGPPMRPMRRESGRLAGGWLALHAVRPPNPWNDVLLCRRLCEENTGGRY